jgi:hypothetical protein
MGLPPQHKNLLKGAKVPWRFGYQNLPAMLGHVSLQKVGVAVSIDLETGLENRYQNISF